MKRERLTQYEKVPHSRELPFFYCKNKEFFLVFWITIQLRKTVYPSVILAKYSKDIIKSILYFTA